MMQQCSNVYICLSGTLTAPHRMALLRAVPWLWGIGVHRVHRLNTTYRTSYLYTTYIDDVSETCIRHISTDAHILWPIAYYGYPKNTMLRGLRYGPLVFLSNVLQFLANSLAPFFENHIMVSDPLFLSIAFTLPTCPV